MPKKRIYTPENKNSDLFASLQKGQHVSVYIKNRDLKLNGVVSYFPRTSRFDEDLRVAIEPINNSFFGQLVISAVTNDYGQYHISEVKFETSAA